MKLTVCLFLIVGLTLCAIGPNLVYAGPATGSIPAAYVAADGADPEMAERAEQSPLEELDPREATWRTWLGPIIIAIFGLVLVFLIRRFSRAEANRDVDPPDPG